MAPIPFITGIGLATPLGLDAARTWNALLAGEAIVYHSRVPGVIDTGEPRVNLLGSRVAREAIADAGWNSHQLQNAALIVGTSKGPVDEWIRLPAKLSAAGERSLRLGLADTAASIASELSIGGPRLTLSAACAGGLAALIRGAMMIRAGEVSQVLIVAAESSLHPLFIESFSRLGVIPPAGHGCRPFDRSRAGFVIAEAACAVCLEAASPPGNVSHEGPRRQSLPAKAYATIDQIALGADATHLTSGDPNAIALRRILRRVIDGRPVELIHAHGTGTIANDPIELSAIEYARARRSELLPSLYSHKAAMGHSLGAAGLVAVAINCLAHRHSIVPPNVRTLDPIFCDRVALSAAGRHRPIRRSLAMAAGFGGAIAAVTLAT